MSPDEIKLRIRTERPYLRRLRTIPGASDYWISDDGRVWSMKSGRPRELKRQTSTRGPYLRITIVTDDGTRRCADIHRLVAETFHGPPPFDGAIVRHLNGIPADVRAENLAWGTYAENNVDKFRHAVRRFQLRALYGEPLPGDADAGGRDDWGEGGLDFFGPLLKHLDLACPHCGRPLHFDWS